MRVIVTHNPSNIGNGFWAVGNTFEISGETPCFYILDSGKNYRVNKKHMSVAGTSCGSHSIKVEILSGDEND